MPQGDYIDLHRKRCACGSAPQLSLLRIVLPGSAHFWPSPKRVVTRESVAAARLKWFWALRLAFSYCQHHALSARVHPLPF